MTRVVFRPEANADLAAIALFIAEHSVTRAGTFVKRLRDRCRVLESHPHAGRPRPELGDGVKSLFERPYVLIYRLEDDTAEIVAIVHAMRDLPAALAARVAAEPRERSNPAASASAVWPQARIFFTSRPRAKLFRLRRFDLRPVRQPPSSP